MHYTTHEHPETTHGSHRYSVQRNGKTVAWYDSAGKAETARALAWHYAGAFKTPHLTRPQMEALRRVWLRGASTNPSSYLAFRRQVQRACYDNCIMLPWAGMWLGIETDGYTHS